MMCFNASKLYYPITICLCLISLSACKPNVSSSTGIPLVQGELAIYLTPNSQQNQLLPDNDKNALPVVFAQVLDQALKNQPLLPWFKPWSKQWYYTRQPLPEKDWQVSFNPLSYQYHADNSVFLHLDITVSHPFYATPLFQQNYKAQGHSLDAPYYQQAQYQVQYNILRQASADALSQILEQFRQDLPQILLLQGFPVQMLESGV
ncbi:hypothetical protein QUF61_12125 [Candidatus Venteria ishoeyi]|uniref:hypothetical protein n=1 Tax=Candidatus Venteria ishoeyi TaxID=1899563 RepID=UPI0025A4F928|nr:hypothetical protein [Candidatus Venteria ishoeyi]MDM8547234.1 hypothetical protein [Candidatus Venteria ishoeyi]